MIMNPYKITQATLITYSGKRIQVHVESEILDTPLRKSKEMLLDAFCKACPRSSDPFVGIEVKTKQMFVCC